jgi:hypothetical protein
MAAAARIEAAGGRVIHMEVGQPAAPAPATAIAAARAALASGRLDYTETLGIPTLRARIARHYRETYGIAIDPGRVVVTTGSSAGFILAFLALFEPGDRVASNGPHAEVVCVPATLAAHRERIGCDPTTVSFFLGREEPVPSLQPELPRWQERIYAFMTRNAVRAPDYFLIPPQQVVELGTKVEM